YLIKQRDASCSRSQRSDSNRPWPDGFRSRKKIWVMQGGTAPMPAAPLQRAAARHARGPGPLEVIAAQPAGHIDRLAYEVQARHGARLHGLLIQPARIDAAAH